MLCVTPALSTALFLNSVPRAKGPALVQPSGPASVSPPLELWQEEAERQ